MNRNRVEDVLFDMGVPASHRGFDYIVDAMEVIEKEGCDVSATKALYPAIAKKNKTKPERVERAIRYALELVYGENGKREVVDKYIGSNRTNTPALVSLYRHLKREEENNAETSKHFSRIEPELDSVIRKIVKEELRRVVAG